MAGDPSDDVRRAIARADAAYESILPFDEWVGEALTFDAWDDAARTLAARRRSASPEAVADALRERLRAAAVETGAIEGLYSTDRGFTMSVAQQTISMDQAEVEKGAAFRRTFEAQLEGYELALDVAG